MATATMEKMAGEAVKNGFVEAGIETVKTLAGVVATKCGATAACAAAAAALPVLATPIAVAAAGFATTAVLATIVTLGVGAVTEHLGNRHVQDMADLGDAGHGAKLVAAGHKVTDIKDIQDVEAYMIRKSMLIDKAQKELMFYEGIEEIGGRKLTRKQQSRQALMEHRLPVEQLHLAQAVTVLGDPKVAEIYKPFLPKHVQEAMERKSGTAPVAPRAAAKAQALTMA